MAGYDDLTYAKRKMELARLDESEMYPLVQSLCLQSEQDDLCLLQLNPEVLETISEGKVLTIRGDIDEPAVICTDSRTYELKEAETSNSLLLFSDMLWPDECKDKEAKVEIRDVCGMFHTYYEMRVVKPKFKKLRTILERSSFKGTEYEDADLQDKYTFENLLDTIQTSEEELKVALIDLQTCTLDGFIRVLDFDYKFTVVSLIIDTAEARSLPIDKIPKESIIESLEDLQPRVVLEQCFSWFACDTGTIDENGCNLYSLNEDAICKFYAAVLLRSSGKFHLNDFLHSWQRSVPEGMKCSLNQLRGIALTDLTCRPEVIFYYTSDDLPENISERFGKLFQVKAKWSFEEIHPYLEDLVSDVKSLLIKHTRESTKDGTKVYSSKW